MLAERAAHFSATLGLGVVMQVKHKDFVEAIRPLVDLLGEDVNGVYQEVRVDAGDDDGEVIATIRVLRAVDPANGTEPVTVGKGDFAALGWPLVAEVVL